MESEVEYKYYICLDMVDGSMLYFDNAPHKRSWTAWRTEAVSWSFPDPAAERLEDYKKDGTVPPNARVAKIRIIVEEVK